MFHRIMAVFLVLLTLCVVGTLVYVAASRHYTDRLVGVNLITTLILNIILVLSLFFDNTAILDIDLIFALLSFLAVVVFCRILRVRMLAQKQAAKKEAGK